MSSAAENESSSPIFSPEELLEGNPKQIKAGLNCIDDVDHLMEFMAYENANQDRTPVQRIIRERITRCRDTTQDPDSGHWITHR